MRWILDELPVALSESVFMQQKELGLENRSGSKQEWECPGALGAWAEPEEMQIGTISWMGNMWEQQVPTSLRGVLC